MTIGLPTSVRNAQLDAITTQAGNGALLAIYSGTRPATGAALSGNTLLAELTCGTPFAPASSNGVLTANAISSVAGAATGTATWARVYKSDGTTFVMDMSVGATGSGADLQLNSTAIQSGATVAVTGGSITAGNA